MCGFKTLLFANTTKCFIVNLFQRLIYLEEMFFFLFHEDFYIAFEKVQTVQNNWDDKSLITSWYSKGYLKIIFSIY